MVESNREMNATEIPRFVAEVIAAGCDINAVGHDMVEVSMTRYFFAPPSARQEGTTMMNGRTELLGSILRPLDPKR